MLVAYLVKNDPHHQRALEDLKEVDVLYVPAEGLIETGLFFRRHGIPLELLESVVTSRDVQVVDTTEDDVIAALRYTAEHPKLFVDYVIYNASVRIGVPFLTYDEEFLKFLKRVRGLTQG
ncbi:MAG: PIN domain-containing protein [Candidatus Diapherotrites archaeon]|nr:PIN domain-containing protein [Candidatus Diapherotrites archaeon]